MSRKYNGLNGVKTDLAKCGICKQCGRRFTDVLCEHATDEQRAYTIALDAQIEIEYAMQEQKKQAAENDAIAAWLDDEKPRYVGRTNEGAALLKKALTERGQLISYASYKNRRGSIVDDREIHSYTWDGE
jgi:hypothetical protein